MLFSAEAIRAPFHYNLESGQRVPIRIEYRAGRMGPKSPQPGSSFHFPWESPSQPVEHPPTLAPS